jgi:serine/threonine protein kinase
VHLDIKPENILVRLSASSSAGDEHDEDADDDDTASEMTSGGTTKNNIQAFYLTDFGLARVRELIVPPNHPLRFSPLVTMTMSDPVALFSGGREPPEGGHGDRGVHGARGVPV